jgi:phosphoribosyl 1,2-cyclic phosphate phosphodiesterase
MEVTILGTAAAEGWPAPFCRCPHCDEARRRGGPNLRARSGVLIDDDLKIDLGPDTVAQMQRTGRSLASVRTILVTHQHSDHLVPSELEWAIPPFTQTPMAGRIELFANAESVAMITDGLKHRPQALAHYDLRTIRAGDRFTTVAGDDVWALPADHCAAAMLFRVRRQRDGRVYFHGHDSGAYPAATLDALSDGVRLDAVTLDCTNGPLELGDRGHMGISAVVRMRDELRRRGALADHARVIATHFSHNGGMGHEELVREFLPHGIEVAFDGMAVRI